MHKPSFVVTQVDDIGRHQRLVLSFLSPINVIGLVSDVHAIDCEVKGKTLNTIND